MAGQKRRPSDVAERKVADGASAADKIAGLLALIATREMEKDAAALKLERIRFIPVHSRMR